MALFKAIAQYSTSKYCYPIEMALNQIRMEAERCGMSQRWDIASGLPAMWLKRSIYN
jgi:hypothetical protein